MESMNSLSDKNDGESIDVYIIHIIGADHVECTSKETIEQAVGPFVQWWQKAVVNDRPFARYLSNFKHSKKNVNVH